MSLRWRPHEDSNPVRGAGREDRPESTSHCYILFVQTVNIITTHFVGAKIDGLMLPKSLRSYANSG